ncbi:hypothetical protein [Streptomyces sp. NPDC014734]|uniref:hypothetical protein n=1 Tax=Streptomyces sp. NPDC014734 TaxID=3364886 RepID=UPI0036FC3DD4
MGCPATTPRWRRWAGDGFALRDAVFGLEATASRIARLVAVGALAQTLFSLRCAAAGRTLHLSADVTADHSY